MDLYKVFQDVKPEMIICVNRIGFDKRLCNDSLGDVGFTGRKTDTLQQQ